jgi:hypothetical protein
VGIPKQEALEEFIMTASLIESLAHDETIMKTLVKSAEDFLEKKQYE